MSTSDILAIIALFFSILTFIWSSLRPARYRCAPIRFIQLAHPPDGNPLIGLRVVISNRGVRDGVIDNLYILFKRKSSSGSSQRFSAVTESEDVQIPKIDDIWKNHVNSFSIQGGASIQKYFWFISKDPAYSFELGEHDMHLYAAIAERRKDLLLHKRIPSVNPSIIFRFEFVL